MRGPVPEFAGAARKTSMDASFSCRLAPVVYPRMPAAPHLSPGRRSVLSVADGLVSVTHSAWRIFALSTKAAGSLQ